MIPATSFLLDGDTALVVIPDPIDDQVGYVQLTHGAGDLLRPRPCDTCGGGGRRAVEAYTTTIPEDIDCPDCDGTGRHTFNIVVVHGELANEYPFRVHVIDVLPIVDTWQSDEPMIFHDPTSPVAEWWHTYATPDGFNMPITMPPAAAPGMWLVRLAVHQ